MLQMKNRRSRSDELSMILGIGARRNRVGAQQPPETPAPELPRTPRRNIGWGIVMSARVNRNKKKTVPPPTPAPTIFPESIFSNAPLGFYSRVDADGFGVPMETEDTKAPELMRFGNSFREPEESSQRKVQFDFNQVLQEEEAPAEWDIENQGQVVTKEEDWVRRTLILEPAKVQGALAKARTAFICSESRVIESSWRFRGSSNSVGSQALQPPSASGLSVKDMFSAVLNKNLLREPPSPIVTKEKSPLLF